MRLLVVTSEPGWAEAMRAVFPLPDNVIACEARQIAQNPALAAAADACFVAEAATSPWTVETLKQVSAVADTPLFVLADSARSQWEDAALFAGAQQIFVRPFRAPVIQLAISRAQRGRPGELISAASAPRTAGATREPAENDGALALWRDFSRLLGRTGDEAALLGEYLDKLREVLRCGRVVLYRGETSGADRSFVCAATSGVSTKDFEAFRLNQRNGLGQLVAERGTVVWRHRLRPDSGREVAALRELMVFGADIAVPVNGREGLAGLLLLGPRISGGDYHESEVALVYHAAEGLAPLLSARDRAAAAEEALNWSLVHALPIAGAVVSGGLKIVEANAAFNALLGRPENAPAAFGDLPPTWSAAIAAAVQNEAAAARVELENRVIGALRRVRLTVRRVEGIATEGSYFLATLEDAAPATTAAQESDAHGIQTLLQRVGEQLSNEFRNALTPVDIMVQLAHDASTTRLELERLSGQVGAAMHRLRRRIDDLAYLTKSAIIPEPTSVSAVLRYTRERLDDWLEAKHLKRIVWLNEFSETPLMADSRAVALALAELIINGIEASDGHPVTITAEDADELVSFRVRNSGVWAPPAESNGGTHRPFVSRKSTGVGLGVEVATRVAENHGGRLLLGPLSADTIEAVMRVPRNVAAVPTRIETRVARVL